MLSCKSILCRVPCKNNNNNFIRPIRKCTELITGTCLYITQTNITHTTQLGDGNNTVKDAFAVLLKM